MKNDNDSKVIRLNAIDLDLINYYRELISTCLDGHFDPDVFDERSLIRMALRFSIDSINNLDNVILIPSSSDRL